MLPAFRRAKCARLARCSPVSWRCRSRLPPWRVSFSCSLYSILCSLAGIIYWGKSPPLHPTGCLFNPRAAAVGTWYPRQLQGRRFSILYSSVSLTGAFGGLLATGLNKLDGSHGISGWRYVSIRAVKLPSPTITSAGSSSWKASSPSALVFLPFTS